MSTHQSNCFFSSRKFRKFHFVEPVSLLRRSKFLSSEVSVCKVLREKIAGGRICLSSEVSVRVKFCVRKVLNRVKFSVDKVAGREFVCRVKFSVDKIYLSSEVSAWVKLSVSKVSA